MNHLRLIACFVFALFVLSGCSPADLLNATIPSSGYTVDKDIAYGHGERHKLDIYIPDHPAAGHPVVVFYYGGRWENGRKDDYLFAAEAFASRGIITVVPDYRLYPQVHFPDFLDDTAAAFVWTHEHIAGYGGNTHNLFVIGHSAGAYNVAMLALDHRYLQAAGGKSAWISGAVGISGPYDFLPLTDDDLIDLFGTRPIAETQPINFVKDREPPMLLLTGEADTDVKPRNTASLAAKLQAHQDDVTVKTYPDLGHIGIVVALADGFRSKAPVLDDCVNFIHEHMAHE